MQKKTNVVFSPEQLRHAVPIHKESKFFVQPGVKNVRSKLKLKNLKGLPMVSEKVEINIEASKFKESDSFLQRQAQNASPSNIGDHYTQQPARPIKRVVLKKMQLDKSVRMKSSESIESQFFMNTLQATYLGTSKRD